LVTESPQATGERLNILLQQAGMESLDPALTCRFGEYCALLMRWNARTNITSIRDEAGILSRHFVESIACARALPAGIATLLDFGSGGGFPGIPIALCMPEIEVTLAESQGKKAAFLQEAVRTLELSARVFAGRAETLAPRFDCVTLRAVDRMGDAMRAARMLVRPGGWLALMTTGPLEQLQSGLGAGIEWLEPVVLSGGERRLLVLARTDPGAKI
jgi:16S rRNA (guanine527-N7)-methyltransferase